MQRAPQSLRSLGARLQSRWNLPPPARAFGARTFGARASALAALPLPGPLAALKGRDLVLTETLISTHLGPQFALPPSPKFDLTLEWSELFDFEIRFAARMK